MLGALTKTGVHTCSQVSNRRSVLTVSPEDPDDCLLNILLQFCTVKIEAALEVDKIHSLC